MSEKEEDESLQGGYHDWVPVPETDAVVCLLCGLTVSMTEFRLSRDTKCDDWPVVTDAA